MKAFEVSGDQDNIVIRFDRDLVDREALLRLLRYAEMESIRKRSRLTERQATALADGVDRAVWERVKHHYTGE